ncbi:MAG: beta-ketoacyl-ACP synthase II [Candidatus Izemoplasmatales bacterium]|jgi:3-oxoacyl-[acyl-carrier-protein] synthase II|nr:beta-ketoacyl-ACP synthase II [Candidatus Izemoplasmatales bacterium]
MRRRVVITGLGAVTPVGNDVLTTWKSIVNGVNGIDQITLFDAKNSKVKIAAEVKNLNIEDYLEPKEARRLDRTIVFGIIAATQAYKDSGLNTDEIDHDRFGTFVSSGIGGLWTINEEARKAHEKGMDRISPFFIPNAIINLVGGNIAIRFQAKGPALPVVTACSSGTNSIGEAFRYIRDGYIEIAFAGGSEAPINELGVGGFASMKALNFSNNKDEASIPFDKRRSGFVIGEGAGVIILEEYEHAKNRNAKIYGEIVGYSTTCDAYHITQPDETAYGITKCMENALLDGRVDPNWIDYINPHGTSTYYNDKLETLGIKNVFKDYAYKINIGATKSMTAHSLGAVGGIEAIICIKALQDGIVPPTINYVEQDPDCDLNYTPNHSVKRPLRYAMSNGLGFGGQNATIIFKKWEEN